MVRPWYDDAVEEIPISKFKATCLAVLETVRTTGTPVRVTRHGQPVAEIVAPKRRRPGRRKLGQMAERDWDALR
jgi:prevent-host-death family protein